MSPLTSSVVIAALLAAASPAKVREESLVERPRFGIEVPQTVLTDVPVRKITLRAYDENGHFDASYNEQPLITGLRLAVPETADAKLGSFKDGVLELTTDFRRTGRKVYIAQSEIVVDGGDRRSGRLHVYRTFRWLCLVPSLIAFLLCLWPRNFILSMFVAVLCGTAILDRGNLFRAFVHTIDSFVTGELSRANSGDASHITLVTVILLFGSLFAVISASGGLAGLSDRLGRYAKTRERGQLLTLVFGLLIFFDDLAHVLVVGKTLRPLADRLLISREKLAFLVNTTAAPAAAIAVVSTWIAAERGTLRETFGTLGINGSALTTLAASIPYCFYPILMLIFAALVIFIGHDYGPMLRAEWRAVTHGQLSRPDLVDPLVLPATETEPAGGRKLARNAWLPILTLFGLMAIGLWWTGREELAANPVSANSAVNSAPNPATAKSAAITRAVINPAGPARVAKNSPAEPAAAAQPAEPSLVERAWLDPLEHSKPERVLLFSSFLASLVAVALAVWSRSLTLQQGVHAWVSGLQRMVPAALILILSWSFQRVCDADHLNVAGFLMELGQPHVTVEWVPLTTFLAVGLTSFVVGSSWAALPLALPLFVSVTYGLLGDLNEAGPMHPLLLSTIGAVIAGTVFGHHCSPISETTILSSASSSCSHLDHVLTQLPYALTVAGVVALFGYAPVAFGYSPVALLPVGTIVLFAILQFGGRPVVEPMETALAATEQSPQPMDPGSPAREADARPPATAAAQEATPSGRR